MTANINPITKLRNAFALVRKAGLGRTLVYYLGKLGLRLTFFWYLKEVKPQLLPANLGAFPPGYALSVFTAADVEEISRIPEREGYINPPQILLERLPKGDVCLGLKHEGRIIGFTWASFDVTRTVLHPVKLAANEAYLYDMYVLKAHRGRNLAPILRAKQHEMLRGMGRDTFYSITETANHASLRFKQKFSAQLVTLFHAVYIEVFNRWKWTWVLKRY